MDVETSQDVCHIFMLCDQACDHPKTIRIGLPCDEKIKCAPVWKFFSGTTLDRLLPNEYHRIALMEWPCRLAFDPPWCEFCPLEISSEVPFEPRGLISRAARLAIVFVYPINEVESTCCRRSCEMLGGNLLQSFDEFDGRSHGNFCPTVFISRILP